MENKRKNFLKALGIQGQSAVEYLLLLSVVVSLGLTVFKSDVFKKMFGENSGMFESLRKRMEYNYRYTQDTEKGKTEDNFSSYSSPSHDSYVSANGTETHFFSPKQKYPKD